MLGDIVALGDSIRALCGGIAENWPLIVLGPQPHEQRQSSSPAVVQVLLGNLEFERSLHDGFVLRPLEFR